MSIWIIAYPRGDRKKLCVAEISEGMEYEKDDYALASRHDFPLEEEAVAYARNLAKEHGLTYEGSSGEHDFLD